MALASIVLVILFSIRNPRRLIFWLPVTLILGPLGLLAWLIAGRGQKANTWQITLIEAIGHLPSIAMALMLFLAVIILFPQVQANQLLQLLFILVFPLLLGWLFYQGPLLALASRQSYLRMLGQRLPVAWVAANLGMGGICLLALRGVRWLSTTCSMMEMSIWALVSLWAVVVAGACLALLLLLFYEGWAVRQGYRAWSVLAIDGGAVTSPSWRRLWGWILLSLVILIGGLIMN